MSSAKKGEKYVEEQAHGSASETIPIDRAIGQMFDDHDGVVASRKLPSLAVARNCGSDQVPSEWDTEVHRDPRHARFSRAGVEILPCAPEWPACAKSEISNNPAQAIILNCD